MKHLKALGIETNLVDEENNKTSESQVVPLKKKVLWGVAPTGEPHLGYAIFIHLLNYLKSQGYVPVILIADYHAYLDNEKVEWKNLKKHTRIYEQYFGALGFEVIKASDFYTHEEYHKKSFKLSTKMDLKEVLSAGYPSLEKSAKQPSVSDVLCVTSQIIDPLFLGTGVVLCGKDEAPIYEYGLPLLEREFGTSINHVYSPMCPGLTLPEMHASLPYENNILLSDSKENVTEKINAYFQQFSITNLPPLVVFCQQTLFPLVDLNDHCTNITAAIEKSDYEKLAATLADGITIVLQRSLGVKNQFVAATEVIPSPLENNISMLNVLNNYPISLNGLDFKSDRIVKKPVFVLGCPRSGTTVIGRCLMHHPNLAGDDESLFVLDLWRMFSDLHGGGNARAWAPLKSFIGSVDLLEAMGKLMDSVFLRFQSADKSYVDQTPWYVALMPFLNLIYPDARFIHVIRNGADIVNSLGVSYEKGFTWAGEDVAARAALWSKLVTEGMSNKTLLGNRYMEIRYENFCLDPVNELTLATQHLGLEWNKNCLEPLSIPHAGPARGTDVTLASRNEAGEIVLKKPETRTISPFNKWTSTDILKFEKIAADAMQLCGYELPNATIKEISTTSKIPHRNKIFTHFAIVNHTSKVLEETKQNTFTS